MPNAKQRNSQHGDNSFDFIVGISYYIINRGKYYFKVYHRPYQTAFGTGKKLAAGDINALQKSDSKDEIADLTNSLINLAHTRKQSSDQAKGEKIKVETILQNMNDGIIAFDLKGNLIHFNREAKKLLNRQYLDDIRFDRFFKEINANITLGDLLYMNPDGSVEREIKLANQYLRLNFAPFKADNKVGGIIGRYTRCYKAGKT